MDVPARTLGANERDIHPQSATVVRHSFAARTAHWAWTLALLVLVLSGLQIFMAAPYLDASDKSDPSKRVFEIGAEQPSPLVAPVGLTTIFGHTFTTTGKLGYTNDGAGGEAPRAFPGWATLPMYRDLASGRVWHLFFGWVLTLALLAYAIDAALRGSVRDLLPRRTDLLNAGAQLLYYLRLRKEPPPHGKYNPLQKLTYFTVLFVMMPLIVLTGLALSPGIDALAGPLTAAFGGRQFARLWHFVLMLLFIAYFASHMLLVFSTGAWNNVRSMITGRYVLGKHDGVGP